MKLKLYLLYSMIFSLLVIVTGTGFALYGDKILQFVALPAAAIIGIEVIIAVAIFENKLQFMDLSKIDEVRKPIEVKETTEQSIAKYIFEALKEGKKIEGIIEALIKSGYKKDLITEVLNAMITQGIIKVPEVVEEKKEEDKPPEIPKVEEEKEEVKEEEPEPEEKISAFEQVLEEKARKEQERKEVKEEEVKEKLEKKKTGKAKCPLCKKVFVNEKKMRRHYGMAHYEEIKIN